MRKAFTLIELLIVVAIIAILAAIAVPNFLEAQTRAKVARAKSDLRSIATAMELYVIDHNTYPLCNTWAIAGNRSPQYTEDYIYLENLSTPVAYITDAFPVDPFQTDMRLNIAAPGDLPPSAGNYYDAVTEDGPQFRTFTYQSWDPISRCTPTAGSYGEGPRPARSWLLQSVGPDRTYINMGGVLDSFTSDDTQLLLYDPTNGTVSFGGVFRVGGQPTGEPPETYGGGFLIGVLRNQ